LRKKIAADGFLFHFLWGIAASLCGVTIRLAKRPIFGYVRIDSGSEFFPGNPLAITSGPSASSSMAIAALLILFRNFFWGITVPPRRWNNPTRPATNL